MKKNPNFSIEFLNENKYFLFDRKNCKGYYLTYKGDIEATLKKEKIEELNKIGFYDDTELKEEHWVNKIFITNSNISPKFILINQLIFFLGLLPIAITLLIQSFDGIGYLDFELLNFKEYGIAMLVFLGGILFIHEMLHVVISRMQGIEIFSIAFKLKYYFIPIFYVKIVPTGNDLKRANVAFAGNIADLILIILYSSLALIFQQPEFIICLNLQLIMSIFNYNIFFPTDFYLGIFSLIGKSNFRTEAINYTKQFIFSKKKQSILKGYRDIIKLAYGLAFYVIVLFMFVIMVLNVYFMQTRGWSF
ncbi:zinc metalloprotease [Bacillus xiapuensis]|uniref:site-2 protease family protein n=1 Tax=Bacillus xiapuensis TaxID=2014075 RepID=UPI000C238AAD|nr:site-2 protease family protein [Bacillus xiapuensis]